MMKKEGCSRQMVEFFLATEEDIRDQNESDETSDDQNQNINWWICSNLCMNLEMVLIVDFGNNSLYFLLSIYVLK